MMTYQVVADCLAAVILVYYMADIQKSESGS